MHAVDKSSLNQQQHKKPDRLLPFLLVPPSCPHRDVFYSAEAVCKLPLEHVLQKGEAPVKSGSPVMEEGKEIGEVVFVQKEFNVGLALIHEFEAVKGAWQVGEEMRGIPVLPFE